MRSFQEYQCEKCEQKFDDYNICEEHESNCNPTESKWCFKCGKVEEWIKNSDYSFSYYNEWHQIHLGRLGYGSKLDGSDVNFEICDDCLCDFVKSFAIEGQEKVINSGCNQYESTDDWIENNK